VLLAWGCGGRGQLGSGTPADSVVPRIVEGSLRGRQILQVLTACMQPSVGGISATPWLGMHLSIDHIM
jgi:Regulator of chromosome condensation (RCC1) repeat